MKNYRFTVRASRCKIKRCRLNNGEEAQQFAEGLLHKHPSAVTVEWREVKRRKS